MSPSTRHGARSIENQLAAFENIMMSTRDLHDERHRQQFSEGDIACYYVTNLSSSRVSGTAAKLWHEPIRTEADGSELTGSPQTGILSPIGLAEDQLRSAFGSASQQESQYRRTIIALFYVAAQMGSLTWHVVGLSKPGGSERPEPTPRSNLSPVFCWWVSE